MDRPPGFVLRRSRKGLFHRSESFHLYCENIPLAKLAERYGTPLYVYSSTTILQRLADFQTAFHNIPHTVCYSVKANSNVNILRLLAREGCGFDVVSGENWSVCWWPTGARPEKSCSRAWENRETR